MTVKTDAATSATATTDPIQEDLAIVEATVEALTSSIPAALSPKQAAAAVGRFASSLMTQPQVLTRHFVDTAVEGAKIVAGTSEIAAGAKDRRFAHEAFTTNPVYKRLAQAQTLAERKTGELIDGLDLDPKSQIRSRYLADLMLSASAPTNQLLGNPAALEEARRTKGRSLVDGARHALHDVLHNGAMPSMVDTRPFTPGDTVACTPGAVVYSNAVLELIQYTPTTETVFERPVFVMPPQINKYYILDLAPGRSLIEHLVSNGHQVLMVSWRNVGPEHRDWNLDTYVAATLEAMDAALEVTGADDLNLLGVCAGGITASALLGHLAAVGDKRVNSVSYLVTILDWDEPSMIGSMISGPVLGAARRRSQRKGVLDGGDLGRVFAWLRPNDLVWNYWVNNYLTGKNPPAFDVLSWNVDATNLPAGLHSDFLQIAGTNGLLKAGHITVLDTPVDLSSIQCDSFVVGAVTDHITPWTGCFATVNALGGTSEFVLSSQGHIQALVNPSGNPKGSFRTGDAIVGAGGGQTAQDWLEQSTEHSGSWWDHWTQWLSSRSGEHKASPTELGSQTHPSGIAAPGSYVHG
ncbi:MAG: alpha/beta fold hydrolase [Acidimicrobiales bacterium]|nr:alpha/beta fold hydrolase [Acidimicrobiales bacterium]